MDGQVVPIGDTLRQLILALGAALVVGNLAVVVRERRRTPKDTRPKPNMRIVVLNIVIGAVLSIWAAASLLIS